MPKIEIAAAPSQKGSNYPPPYDAPFREQVRRRLGDAGALTQFGVNLLILPPGVWGSHRHWHSHEDEFVWVLEGEVVLVTDAGAETLRAGDCAAFPAGVPNGHQLKNLSDHEARVLEIGTRNPDDLTEYPDKPKDDE
jgi:uncharacterized cupin superfamily protein